MTAATQACVDHDLRRRTWGEACGAHIRWHDLRHSHASHLLKAGVIIKVVSRRLGHASVSFTLDRYGHLMPDDKAAAALSVAALVDGVGSGVL